MQQEITETHAVDADGLPAGGITSAKGLQIDWQDGPLAVDGVRREPNGCFVETVIAAAIGRLEFYEQASGGRFSCIQNESAILHLRTSLKHLHSRTAERTKRGVEGTHQP